MATETSEHPRFLAILVYRGHEIMMDVDGDSLTMQGTLRAKVGDVVLREPTLWEMQSKIDRLLSGSFHIEAEHPETHKRVVLTGYLPSINAWYCEDGTLVQAWKDLHPWDEALSAKIGAINGQMTALAEKRRALEDRRPRIYWNRRAMAPSLTGGERPVEVEDEDAD